MSWRLPADILHYRAGKGGAAPLRKVTQVWIALDTGNRKN
jgi:hypothetical protein